LRSKTMSNLIKASRREAFLLGFAKQNDVQPARNRIISHQ